MSENDHGVSENDHGVDGSGVDDAGVDGRDDISAADEQALRAMFAALVQDAEPSELSPLEVRRLAKHEDEATLDRRVKRLKFTRNALVAAVLAGVVALLIPHLGSSSSSTAASSSSSAAAAPAGPAAAGSAAATSAASGAAGSAAPMSAAADGTSAAGSAPASGGASGSSATGGAAPAPAAGGSAAGSAASSEAMSSGAASSGGASDSASGGSSGGSSAAAASSSSAAATSASSRGASAVAGCVPVSPRWFAPVRAALPGYRGTVRITSCSGETSGGPGAGTVDFVVSTARSAVCRGATAGGCQPVAGTPVPGTKDAYVDGGAVTVVSAVTVVGAGAPLVTVTTTPGGPDRQALITAARALLKAVG